MPAPLVLRSAGNPDALAADLARMAQQVRALPPSFRAGVTIPIVSPLTGARLGSGLPGYGITTTTPLRRLGISRRAIPGVYDRPVVERLQERLRDHVGIAAAIGAALIGRAFGSDGVLDGLPFLAGAITNMDGIIEARAAGRFRSVFVEYTQNYNLAQGSHANFLTAPNTFGSWSFTGSLGASAPSADNVGSLLYGTGAAPGSNQWYMVGFGISVNVTMQAVFLTDVLYECGGIPATSAGPHSLGAAALTRYTDGAGVVMALIATTSLSATANTITISYTNQTPTGSRSTTVSHPSTSNAGAVGRFIGNVIAIPFQSSDYGVRSVQSVTNGTALAAGVMALILHRPLLMVPYLASTVWAERDVVSSMDGLIPLVPGTDGKLPCLGLICQSNASGTAVGCNPRVELRLLNG